MLVETLKKHFEKPNACISVVNGNKKLAKKAKQNKYMWTKEDVLNDSGSYEQFLTSLPSRGFGHLSVLEFRFKVGTRSYNLEAEVTLKQKTAEAPKPQLAQPTPNVNPQNNKSMLYDNDAPKMQLGYVPVAQDALINLKLTEARYNDLSDKLRLAQKTADQAESDLRKVKADLEDKERKLNLIEEKYEWRLEQSAANNKKFYETETGQAVVGQLAGRIPEILSALKSSGNPQPALGHPILANLTPQKEQLIAALNDAPDEFLDILKTIVDLSFSAPTFYDELTAFVALHTEEFNKQNPQ